MMASRLGKVLVRSRGLLHAKTFSSASMVSSRRAFSAQPADLFGEDDDAGNDQKKKATITAAWNNSAEGYVRHIQDGGGAPLVNVQASVGYKVAARVVVNLSNKRCEGAVTTGKEICKERATYGDPAEGATACQLHKDEDMVPLKGSGAPVILDVASAGGEPAITIAKALPGATVHATDIAPAMMDLIRRRAAEAGVSNVKAAVADGEALTGFGDNSVDAVCCTFSLMFMLNWQRAIQEFSRVLTRDGVVVMTLWEKCDDSVLQRLGEVLETLVPGFEGLIDPVALAEDDCSAVVEEMKAAGLSNVSVSQFSVPVVLSPEARPRDIWDFWTRSTPLGQTIASLEAKGRTNVRREAMEVFEGSMIKDWAEGRTPLGLPPFGDAVASDGSGSRNSSPATTTGSPLVFYARAFVITGRKCGA